MNNMLESCIPIDSTKKLYLADLENEADNKHECDLLISETKATKCVFVAPPILKSERGLKRNVF